MKMKVLAIATTFPRWQNDVSPRFVYDLSNKLGSKYELMILAPHHKGAKKQEKMGNLTVKRFAYFKPESLQKLCYGGGIIPNMRKSFLARIQMPFLILSEFFAASAIIKKDKISMIHAHWMLPQGLVGVYLKRKYKIPLLVTIHGSDLFPLKNLFFKKIQKLVIKNADFVTVNSEATINELRRRFPQCSNIKVIPMGIDINLFKKRKIKKPNKYLKNKLLLSVGRLSDQKGLQYLIDSMQDILKYDSKVRLLIVGEGPFEKELRKRAKNREVEKNIEFLGPLSLKDITKFHNYADIFILPSLSTKTGTEALGLSLLEAMSSGCAVIGTKVGGIPYIIKDNDNGVLVRQKDSQALSRTIITLLKDKKKTNKLGKNAAKFARRGYSWETISSEFIKIYDSILK